jgi:hypothetical protein
MLENVNILDILKMTEESGQETAQLLEALSYKTEGCGFDFRRFFEIFY